MGTASFRKHHNTRPCGCCPADSSRLFCTRGHGFLLLNFSSLWLSGVLLLVCVDKPLMSSIFKAFWQLSQLDCVVVTDKTKRLLGAFSLPSCGAGPANTGAHGQPEGSPAAEARAVTPACHPDVSWTRCGLQRIFSAENGLQRSRCGI